MTAAAPEYDAARSAWTDSGARPALVVPRVLPDIEVFSESISVLGEGPSWNPETESVDWVDIKGGKVFSKSLHTGQERVWQLRQQPSATIQAQPEILVVPSGRSVLQVNLECGRVETLLDLPGEPMHNRCNDAKCDPEGNLWIGTMDEGERARTGRLWRVTPDGDAALMLDGLGIPNTLAWDEKRGRFYFADSMAGDIYVCDYDPAAVGLGPRRIFFPFARAPGTPDGSAIDEDGYLWNARWDGACVIRISPDGNVDRVIEVPAKCPTSCAFGGSELETLFVTSASAERRAPRDPQHLDGAVFRVNLGVAGQPVPRYRAASWAPTRSASQSEASAR